MPSHVKYTQIDPINITTQSKKVLDLFENTIKKKMIFISDDLRMHGAKQVLEKEIRLNKQYTKRQCDILLSGNRISLDKVSNLTEKSLVNNELLNKLELVWSYLREKSCKLNFIEDYESHNKKSSTSTFNQEKNKFQKS